jgi:O-antigen/teichoic acid export membrane protein
MARKKIAFGVGAGVLSTGVDGLAGLLNVHFLNRFLPGTVSGYWMLCLTVGGFLVLAQSAVVPVVARLTAQHSGHPRNWSLVLARIRELIRRLVGLQLIISGVAFFGYLRTTGRTQHLGFDGLGIWVTYALALVCALDASARFAVLNGYGEVGWDKVTRIGTGIAGALLTWLSLHSGWGLMGLSLTTLSQSVVTLVFAEWLLRRHHGRTAEGLPQVAGFAATTAVPRLAGLIRETAKLLGLGFIGYLVTSFGAIAIERRLGLERLNQFAALNRIGVLLVGVACLVPQMFYPFVARAWAEGQYVRHRRFVLGGLAIAVGVYVLGALTLWLVSPVLGPLWLGRERFLGSNLLGWILLSYGVLVLNVSVVTPVLASTGKAFAGVSIFNLVVTPPIIWWLVGRQGVVGAPMGFLAGTLLPSLWTLAHGWKLMIRHGRVEGRPPLTEHPGEPTSGASVA